MQNKKLEGVLEKIPSPCFVLDEEKLESNLKVLQRIQSNTGAKIICALKGYAMHSSFNTLQKYLVGATASSLNEALLAKEELGREVHVYCPAYRKDEFTDLMNLADHLTFNSISEYKFYEPVIKNALPKKKFGLRINPEYSNISTPIYDPCAMGSRLGITIENMPKGLPEMISGLHFHTLCEGSAEVLAETLKAVEEKFSKYLNSISWLNFGGGHAITKKEYNIDLLEEAISNIKSKYNLEVILEPGSAVAWDAGWLVTSVLDIVNSGGVSTAIIDSSFAAHMPDCIEMPYKPKVTGSVSSSENNYTIGGLTCLAGDYMSDYYFEEPLSIGQKVIFEDMMHYTMVKTTHFNGIALPSIGILKKDGTFELVKTFGYKDYKNQLS